MQSTPLIVVRHGETEWNIAKKWQGHSNSDLTPTGIKQAQKTAEYLADKDIEVIYSSDLGRAAETAKIIAEKLCLPVNYHKGLREKSLGIFEGHTLEGFAREYPEEYERFINMDEDYVVPGGESSRQRYERSISATKQIVQNHSGCKVLIVTHGGVLDSYMRKALNISLAQPRSFSIFNAGVSSFLIQDNNWKLESWGIIDHLKDFAPMDGKVRF